MKTLIVSVLLAATAASAQSTFLSDTKKPLESPRSMFIEVKVGYFLPNIDKQLRSLPDAAPAAEQPYAKIFGTGWMWLGEIEVEYQFFQKFGTLAAGLSVGYAEKYGKAYNVQSQARSGESSGLRFIPIKALLVYRFDYAKQRWNVPLVPYVKVAFVAAPWWITAGKDVEVQPPNDSAISVSLGFAETFGLALQLDFLDPRLARDFDSSVGVNHTYLFAEGTLQQLNVFNQVPGKFDMSSEHFSFGLGFEF